MAINQLQYMSLSMSVIKYDDIRQRLLTSAKDEDISPFTAVDKYDINYPIFTQKRSHLFWLLYMLYMSSYEILLNAVSNFLFD